MNALYSLYDALLSIEVPADKARAVVTALEQEMSNVLATKSDLQHTETLLRQELVATRDSLKQEIDSTRDLLKQEIDSTRDSLKQEIYAIRDSLRQDMELMRSSMTIRLGSLMIVGMGMLFAALRLTGTE